MTKSASSVHVSYGYETNFGAGVASPPMLFGKEVKANGLEFKNNQIPIGQLYSPEIDCFAYGRNEGKVSVEYVLSNPWFLESILGTAVSALDAGALYSHTWDSDPSNDATMRDVTSMALRIGYDVNTDFLRDPVGVICNALTLKMTLNETIKVTQELVWGEESVNQSFLAPTGTAMPGEVPYTFVNAVVTSPITGSTLATVQDMELNINSNAELLFELGGANAVDAYRKLLEMTGKLTITVKDSTFLEEVYGRAETPNDLVVTISNGAAGDAERSITLTFTGCSFSTHNNTGIAPGELVLENVDFQCRKLVAVAKNEETAVP